EDGRFAPKQVQTPQTVLRVTKNREPGRPRRGWFRLIPSRQNASHHIRGDGKTEGQGFICCAIRGDPQLGFRCFMSTTAAMTSWLGPFGPGFLGALDEKRRQYFRCTSAR